MAGDRFGELFWDGAIPHGTELLLYPGVPLHGKAPENAVLVGVIDSGISSTHPQLAGYARACADFGGGGPEDTLGHGTMVALQLLFANGVSNPAMAILSANVTDAQGRIRQRAVIEAIDWVAEQGAAIVNLSLGFRGKDEDYRGLCAAIAGHPNIRFFAAAGNYGPDVKVFPSACGCENLKSVGAVDKSGGQAAYSGAGAIYAPGDALFLKDWAYHYEQGQALARDGKPQEARAEYERSLSVQPNAASEFGLGVLDLNQEDVAATTDRFERAIGLEPAFAEAHEMLGAARFLAGEYESAEAALRQSIALYPENDACLPSRARAYFNLGQTLVRLGRRGEARTAFETVKALMPDYPRIDVALRSAAG